MVRLAIFVVGLFWSITVPVLAEPLPEDKYWEADFIRAIIIEDLYEVERAYDDGLDINHIFFTGSTALDFAVKASKLESVRLLLDLGADPNFHGPNSLYPITAAITGVQPDIAMMLLDAGASGLLPNNSPTFSTLSHALFHFRRYGPPGKWRLVVQKLISKHSFSEWQERFPEENGAYLRGVLRTCDADLLRFALENGVPQETEGMINVILGSSGECGDEFSAEAYELLSLWRYLSQQRFED